LSGFLEQQQLQEPTPTEQAAPMLEALCHAAASLQDIHRSTPPTEGSDERWLLLPSARVNDDGRAVSTQLLKLRLWVTPRLEAPCAWFEHLGEGVALTMVAIPAGSFLMGSPPEEQDRELNEGPQHRVCLEGFWISQGAISQAQWQQVMGSNPSHFTRNRVDRDPRPVERVSWNDAMTFCNHLRQQTGRRYTLASEAQWEYACRAGTTTPFSCGGTVISELANSDGNHPYGDSPVGEFRAQTSPVGQYPANPWGLHDMHGNVREWCLDEWHDNYEGAPGDGSAWVDSETMTPSSGGEKGRLLRGGSWFNFPRFCRSAYRFHLEPDYAGYNFGFRVVCLPQDPSLNT
jgi:formylglycine-generating enzyme required for sulfatase activity